MCKMFELILIVIHLKFSTMNEYAVEIEIKVESLIFREDKQEDVMSKTI
jgi:hypothetical protein